jgi:asparagine synthetase B (glutamine-hydrolysing)
LTRRAEGGQGLPLGQYAKVERTGDDVLIARDPLGCAKVFYGRDGAGDFVVSNRIARLVARGVPLADVAACPPGRAVRLRADVRDLLGTPARYATPNSALDAEELQSRARERLAAAFMLLAKRHRGARFVVCLSGGSDSSIIAGFAAKYLPGAICCSFSFRAAGGKSDALLQTKQGDIPSDDFRAAARVAQRLDMTLLPVRRTSDAVRDALPLAVGLCQDWRDFNVHCAIVNLFLAQDIRAHFPDDDVVVLTGDLMNEYLCDYHEENVDGQIYYRQPRVDIARRRDFFVMGLDAGDREIGVFGGYGLTLYQPYALLADLYMTLPAAELERPNFKQWLNAPLLAEGLTDLVSKQKTRAQVGGKDMGVLGVCHRLGVTPLHLQALWKEAVAPDASLQSVLDLIQVGKYRASA